MAKKKQNLFLKPSEALEIGMRKSRRCEGALYKEGGHQGHAQTCALGAMALGFGFTKDEMVYSYSGDDKLTASEIDERLQREAKHPVDHYESNIGEIIIDLNDHHSWTRARIARWLKKLGL